MKYIFLLVFSLLFPSLAFAQESEESFKGTILEIFEVPCSESLDDDYRCYEYEVYVAERGATVRTIPSLSDTKDSKFLVGDKVYVSPLSEGFDYESWSITGFVREFSVFVMITIFAIVAVLIGKRQGFGSLVSLIFTVLILYGWAIPKILEGGNVLLIGVSTVCITLVLIMYTSHGLNMKSSIAVLSTFVGVVIVALLAKIFTTMMRVDGSGSEEAFLLLSQMGGGINLSEVFFVSILIGAVGVLDDVVMSQVSAIYELNIANPKLNMFQLLKQGMNIGKDHLSSMVNTLFIAYAGSSFALVMLLTYNSGGIGNILRADVIAEEIVRTLSASIGILLIVPITSLFAAYVISKRGKLNSSGGKELV